MSTSAVQDPQQRVPVEPERSRLLQPAAGLRRTHARNRHPASVASGMPECQRTMGLADVAVRNSGQTPFVALGVN